MATQLEGTVRMGGDIGRTVALTPQARRLLEGPVLATLLRLAAPTVALVLLQGVNPQPPDEGRLTGGDDGLQ